MKNTEVKQLMMKNSLLWIAAMVLPAIFSLALASTKFPWQIVLPMLLLGPMMASNKMISRAGGE